MSKSYEIEVPPLDWSQQVEIPSPLSTFTFSDEVLTKIATAWSCSLSQEIVSALELTCRAMATT
jgi:hypothetical protein